MNKLLIVFLAIALVSVHAFVKRDTAEPAKPFEAIEKQLQELSKSLNDQLSKTFNADEIKKGFNEIVDSVTKSMNDLKAKSETPK